MADTTKQSPPIEEEESRDLWSVSSLASTANDLVFEYGRRFPNHRINTSPFPGGDQLSRDNEQALHNLNLCIYDDRLFIAPINNPTNVLDVQCGELGLWSKDMADRYPEAQITGMDKYVPDTEGRENLSFNFQIFTDDPWVLDEITQVYGKFDLIYIRAIFGSNCDLQGLYQRCMEHLTPGGYIEQCEIVPYCQCSDGASRKDSVMARICSLIPTFESNLAVNYNPGADMAEVMGKVGFTDIKQDIRNCPWSPWHPPGTKEYEIGCYLQKYYETGIHGWIVTPLRKHVGMDADTVENMVKAATIEIQQNDQHWWSPVITVTARKPTDTPA